MPDWSAYRSIEYGYTRVQALNKTHLYVEQVSDDQVNETMMRDEGYNTTVDR
jgi:hypothetical protein